MFHLPIGWLAGRRRAGGGSEAAEEPAERPWSTWAVLLAVLIVAAFLRFVDLGRAAVRADEINFLQLAARGQSLLAIWRDPPWMNQIPFADSIAIVWHWFRPGTPTERTVREPFALLGFLTVIGVAVWLTRRQGIAAGALAGAWMAVLPFHVYHSREAYYYVVVMACAAGMTLQTIDLLKMLRGGERLSFGRYAAWTSWTVLTCLTHMSTWMVALVCWMLLAWKGFACLTASARRNHLLGMIVCAVVIGAVMDRWIWRAISEMQNVSRAGGHLGSEFAWVQIRIIPFFTAGMNAAGVIVSVLLLMAGACMAAINRGRRAVERDVLYNAVSLVTVTGFIAAYVYVGVTGGGVAKVTYFSAMLPVFLVWSAFTVDLIAARLPVAWRDMFRVALPCVVVMALAKPAWMITQLDGKPTPYKQLRAWLDENLDAGSVAVVDRWFEPWNEMALYAPSKVFVTFTVPDEPYETYRQLRWRDVTKQAIEQGKVQAFIRLARNYEDRDGPWAWPESFFARRAEVINEPAIWLRDHGYAPGEEFYASNRNRIVTEIFYDLREDEVARKRAAGDRFAVFFDESMRVVKTGPLAIFSMQTEQFMDWRLLLEAGTFQVYNLTDRVQNATVRIRAVSPGGEKVVVGRKGTFRFTGGALQEWLMEPVLLEPGENSIVMSDPRWADVQQPLLVADVEIVPEASP